MPSPKIIFLSSFVLLVAFALWWLKPPVLFSNKSLPLSKVSESGTKTTDQFVSLRLESFVQNLDVPWSMVFTSPERILVTERPGRVRVVENGRLLEEPLRVFTEASNRSEEGLMGMTLDPDYTSNRFVYLCLAYRTAEGQIFDKVIRVKDGGGGLIDDQVIIDRIPAAANHAGCRLRFGPDEKLYISTGDASDKSLPQDLTLLAGKILRLNADGSIPVDNPFVGSPVYSYGHRNGQGFDWHPVSGVLIATEHGPSGNDGPGGGDEVNLIREGQNYGWPEVSHQRSRAGMVDPLIVFTPAIAPASGMFYRSEVIPQLKNTFLFGMLRGEGIMQVIFTEDGQVDSYQKLAEIGVGRVRDVVEGPDGYLYFTTSNQDGRGRARSGDDQIFRLVRAEQTTLPFQELTIPYLRERNYLSQLGEMQEVARNNDFISYLTSYDSDGLRVEALLTVPTGEKPIGGWPAIVFIHGYIPPEQYRTREKYVDYVNGLARSGFVVLKIDLRGHGNSEGEASGAYYSSDYIIDALNARAALAATDFVDGERIGMWGHSMAGNVVLRSLASRPEIPAAVIWAGAVFSYSDWQELGLSDGSYRPPGMLSNRQERRRQLFATHGEFNVESEFWRQVAATNYLTDLQGAIQLHHAINDDVVSVEYSRDLTTLLERAGVTNEFHEYSSGGHNLTSPSFSQAMERTVEFFRREL